jgi:hypothetical protein
MENANGPLEIILLVVRDEKYRRKRLDVSRELVL